jgi:hypothetical protein
MSKGSSVERAASRVLELEAEVESAGNAATRGSDLAFARAALHDWVESVVGIVSSPGVGRVTLIHSNGTEMKIASPDLPYLLLPAVSFAK